MRIKHYVLFVISLICFFGCNTGNQSNEQVNNTGNDSIAADSTNDITYIMISPGEIFEYIFFDELKPDPGFVNPITNAKKYITTDKMALNLGVYTTDFIYLNLCTEKKQILDYYKVILELAPQINIYSGANDNLPERIQKNFAIHDSINDLSKQVYYRILEDLEQEGRQKIYSLIAGGVIIESVYLALMNVKKYEDFKPLTQKIFEQKEFLNNTFNFISTNKTDKDISLLLRKLDELQQCFNNLETSDKSLAIEENAEGHLKIEGGSENIISEKDFEKLKMVASKVRNEIISEK